MKSQILETTTQQHVTAQSNQSEDLPEFQVRALHMSDCQPTEAQRGCGYKATQQEEGMKGRQAAY